MLVSNRVPPHFQMPTSVLEAPIVDFALSVIRYRLAWMIVTTVIAFKATCIIYAPFWAILVITLIYKQDPDRTFCQLAYTGQSLQTTFFPKLAPHHTKVRDYVILGAMPTKNWEHLEMLQRLGITDVMSFNQTLEFERLPHLIPLRKEDFQEAEMSYHHFPMVDMQGVTNETFDAAYRVFADAKARNGVVYDHCLAGRGRSFSVLVAFISLDEGKDVDEVITEIKALRPTVNLRPKQLAAINEYVRQKRENCA